MGSVSRTETGWRRFVNKGNVCELLASVAENLLAAVGGRPDASSVARGCNERGSLSLGELSEGLWAEGGAWGTNLCPVSHL